jgi:hypothetical protein
MPRLITKNLIVRLSEENGNAYAIIARCKRVAKRNGVPDDEWAAFLLEATSGNYDHAIQTVMQNFDVE